MNKTALWLCLLLATIAARAQTALPDSLQIHFVGVAKDSSYVTKLNSLATGYLRTNPQAARIVSNHTLEVADKIKYTRGHARALTIIGNSFWYEGVYEFAQKYYLMAARQSREIGDSIGLGQAYNNIGEVYKKLNEFDKALKYLERSVELKKRDSSTRAITLYNIAEIHILLNNIAKAKYYIDQSHQYALQENNKRVLAFNYWAFAAIALKEGKHAEALQYLDRSEKLWASIGELRSLVRTYHDISEVYRMQKNFEGSERYLKKAILLANNTNVPDLQVSNYLQFAKLDSSRGKFASALHHIYRHNHLKDSVYTLMKAEQIARLQTIYETEATVEENQQLRTEQRVKDAQLASQKVSILTISAGLLIAGVLAWLLYAQQKKIVRQKESIECQAAALLTLNKELQHLNRTLEARIEQRTSQLAVQNERLTEYTFINAHRLRAPVARMLGLIHLLGQGDGERSVIVEHLQTCGEDLDNVIKEVGRDLENAMVQEADYQ